MEETYPTAGRLFSPSGVVIRERRPVKQSRSEQKKRQAQLEGAHVISWGSASVYVQSFTWLQWNSTLPY